MRRGNFLPIVVASLAILILTGFVVFRQFSQKPNSPVTSSDNVSTDPCEILINGSQDFPALYGGNVGWKNEIITEYEVPVGSGSKLMTGCLITSQPITSQLGSDSFNYYIKTAQNLSWKIIDGGDSPDTGFATWQIGEKFFLFRITSAAGYTGSKAVTLFLSK